MSVVGRFVERQRTCIPLYSLFILFSGAGPYVLHFKNKKIIWLGIIHARHLSLHRQQA